MCGKAFEWGRGCRNKNSDRLLNIPELPTNDDRLPTNDDRLPTNDDRLPTNDDRLPTTADLKASIYQQAIELPTVSAKLGGVTFPHPLLRHTPG